jgi:FkbM family methyltransferase
MIFTTKAKIFLKKHAPSFLFSIIRFVADNTLLKILPLIFKAKIIFFTKKVAVHIHQRYGHFDIYIDPKNGYLDQTVYATRNYEPHIANEIYDAINKDDVCIDIGANIGYHTIIMSQKAGTRGHVFAYEPIPYIRKQLQDSLALNNIANVTTLETALSNEKGMLNLHLSETNVAGSSFINTSGTSIKVEVRTLDSYNYQRVDFIKLDVEGFEYNVLLGATDTVQRCRPTIIFEYSPTYYRKSNASHVRDILYFFDTHNYTMIDLEDNKKVISDISLFINEFNIGLRSQTNILATPK